MVTQPNFCVTVFGYTDDQILKLKNKIVEYIKYCVFGYEMTKDLKPHLQGYIYFNERKTKTNVLELLSQIMERDKAGITVIPARGTGQQNRTYCVKEGNICYEYGDVPERNTLAAQQTNEEKYKEIINLARKRKYTEIQDTYPGEWLRMQKSIINTRTDFDLSRLLNPCGALYYGAPATGKTQLAKSVEHYDKSKDKWWDNYNGEDRVVIDDITTNFMLLNYENLLKWLDMYPFKAEIKGGYIDIRPKEIIITTNHTPEELFNTVPLRQRDAIKRRFKEIKLFEHNDLLLKQ